MSYSPSYTTRLRACAAVLLLLGATLQLTGVAIAGCPDEQAVHCASFDHRAKNHNYRLSQITIGLNGRPACTDARRLIISWLGHPSDRIYDTKARTFWFKTSSEPLEFTAGLCGYLRFHLR